MLAFEYLAVGYFTALAVAAPAAPAGRGRIAVTMAFSVAAAGLVWWVSHTASDGLRVWSPHAYLVAGYWMPALLLTGTPGRFETWLRRNDRRWRWLATAFPKGTTQVFELAYLCCYPLIPVAFLTVRSVGGANDVERFWVSVLGAGYLCYASLPWLVSRPPRLIRDNEAPDSALQRLNSRVLGQFSHQFVTFPSGHVAVSTAAAIAVLSVSFPTGLIMVVVTCGIALAAISGGYHYVLDVLLGAAVGIVSALLSSWF